MTIVNSKYQKKSASRLAAVQTLYEILIMDVTPKTAIQDYVDFFQGDKVAEHKDIVINNEFYESLVAKTQDRCSEINKMIDKSLPERITPERLDNLARAILQAGICELLTEEKTDTAVIINEYVDVTHAFYSGKEHSLINGILNALSKKIRH